jgi:hypothetical protein
MRIGTMRTTNPPSELAKDWCCIAVSPGDSLARVAALCGPVLLAVFLGCGVQAADSGLRGTTTLRTFSGAEGGKTIERKGSLEFAIAPVREDRPVYAEAVFVTSDAKGEFQVMLHPGTYWIGPRGKVEDPVNFDGSSRGSVVFAERRLVIEEGAFAEIELRQDSYAP